MSQEIKPIRVRDLALWTENPRDPIGKSISDQDFADRAIQSDQRKKWSLKKLRKTMGLRFDQSEIPTVVNENGKSIVYDGNRRVLIGKIIHSYVTVDNRPDFSEFDFPEIIPCNVCDRKTALEHVDRKHGEGGSWEPLERDIFRHREMKKDASPFLILDEATKIISSNPELNKGFVRDEVFDKTNLHKMGFSVNSGKFKSCYPKTDEGEKILSKVEQLVASKVITTRKNRGKIIDLLKEDKEIKLIISKNKGNQFKDFHTSNFKEESSKKRKTRTTKDKGHKLFGEKLILNPSRVNNIYSDLCKLHEQKRNYSSDFPRIIRMGLRLICDLATKESGYNKIDDFLKNNFEEAKNKLSQDEKTTLSAGGVVKNKFIELLHVGAHAYTAGNNIEQTVALSLVIGKILKSTHGK